MAEVLQIETPALGDRSYLVHDGTVALVIDPQRDTDRITALPRATGCAAPTSPRRTSTTTTSPAARPWPPPPARRTWSTPPTRSVSTGHRSATATPSRSAARCGCGRWPPPATPLPT